MQSTLKPALVLTSGRTVAFAATFCIPLVLARLFDPAQFGAYKQLFLVYGTVLAIGQFGMAESLYYFLPRQPDKAGSYILNSLAALAATGLVSLVIIVWTGESIARWLNNPAIVPYLLALGVYLVLTITAHGLEIAMVARSQYKWAATTYVASDIVKVALLIVPVLIFRSIDALFAGIVLHGVFRCAAVALYLHREPVKDLRLNWPCFREQLMYAVPFGLAVLVDTLQANLHQYAVSHYFDAATFALYAVGCLQIPIVDFIASPMSSVMMVRIGENVHEKAGREVISIWNDTTRTLALLFCPLVGLLLVNGRGLIILLFTERYAGSIPIFMVWSLGILFAILPTDCMLRVCAQTRFLFMLNVVKLGVIGAGIGAFLRWFDLIGAVFITLVALGLAKALALMKIKKELGVGMKELLPWGVLAGTLIASALAAVPALLVGVLLNHSGFVSLVVAGTVYATAYASLVLAFGLLSEEHKLALTSTYRGLASTFRSQPAEGD